VRQGKPVLLPGANDARLALAENEVLKVDVGGDLVTGGDQTNCRMITLACKHDKDLKFPLISALKIALKS
jgi:hypothetical protein